MGQMSKDEVNVSLFDEVKKQKERIKELESALVEVSECIDSFYDDSHPRQLYSELSKFLGYISTIDTVVNKTLNKREYTGKVDNNGNKIYEGMTLKGNTIDGNVGIFKVGWDDFRKSWIATNQNEAYDISSDIFYKYEILRD